jgi:hypothetical protein
MTRHQVEPCDHAVVLSFGGARVEERDLRAALAMLPGVRIRRAASRLVGAQTRTPACARV